MANDPLLDLARTRTADAKTHRPRRRLSREEKDARERYVEHLSFFLCRAQETRERLLTFLAAADLLSRRYFAGQDLLYPKMRKDLELNARTVATLADIFMDLAAALGQPGAELHRGACALTEELAELSLYDTTDGEGEPPVYPATSEARRLAEEWVLMARSESLFKLGERAQADKVADRVMREYAGWGS